jgi:hypothetical protein
VTGHDDPGRSGVRERAWCTACDSGFHGPFLIHPGGVSRRALDADVAPHLRGLIISRGDPTVFLTRPVSLTLLILAVIAFAIAVLPTVRRKREAVFEEEV